MADQWGALPTKKRGAHIAWKATRDILDVPHDLYASLLSAMPTPDEPALRQWLADTEAAWAGKGVADAYPFWRARSTERWAGKVAGLAGGGTVARPTVASGWVIDPDYRGAPYRFHCAHSPACVTWPQCREQAS